MKTESPEGYFRDANNNLRTPTKTEIAGGKMFVSPLLIQAARSALAEWKFAPAGTESKETIEMHFEPPKNDSR